MRKVSVTFADVHFPHQSDTALAVLEKVVKTIIPDYTASLGDLLDCSQFSSHESTYGIEDSDYNEDLNRAKKFLDGLQESTKERLILIEGNHEFRIKRWAANSKEGRGLVNMVAPHIQLMRRANGQKRDHATYIPYGSADGCYPHYKLNRRVALIHGWSYAKNVCAAHLALSQGMTILCGHCHRMESKGAQSVWGSGNVYAHAIGCMCQRIPLWGTGNPVEWVNAFCLGFHGRHSDTFYTIPITNGSCILPDGREIRV